MKKKAVLVTGGANGIGRATAQRFLEQGMHVAIVDYDEEALNDTLKSFSGLPGQVLGCQADLSDLSQARMAFANTLKQFGRIDCLVNSAARLGGPYDLAEVKPEDWERMFRVNVTSVLVMMQCFSAHVEQRGGGGRIVNLSSSSAFRAQRARPAYASGKGALNTLTRIAAAQYGSLDINVNAVAPGITNTPGATTKRNIDPSVLLEKVSEGPNANLFRRVTEAEDVAECIVFLCGPGSRQITGQIINVSAGAIM